MQLFNPTVEKLEVKLHAAELLKELERRKGMSNEENISEEFVGKLKGMLHQVRMGRWA